MSLSSELQQITQRTGSSSGTLSTRAERIAHVNNVTDDIANIVDQLNNVYYPLVEVLSSGSPLDALSFGLSGNVIFTHVSGTAGSGAAYWDSVNARTKTIKETIDTLLAEISRLENLIETISSPSAFDDSALIASIAVLDLDLDQVVADTFGGNYTLDSDGAADLTYTLSQRIDAIGGLFTGYASTGITHGSTYPTLSFTVNLSDVNVDTTLPQSAITDLSAELGYIRTFIGKTVGNDTPAYSAHGTIAVVTDGDSLELAIRKLDARVTSGSGSFATASNITSNSPGTLATDDFVFGSASLSDSGNSAHDSRFFYDKSLGYFFAGTVTGVQADTANRGSNSANFGSNNTVGANTSIVGGVGNTTSTGDGHIVGGNTNTLFAGSSYCFVQGNGNTFTDFGTGIGILGDTNIVQKSYTDNPAYVFSVGSNNIIDSATNGIAVGDQIRLEGENNSAFGQFNRIHDLVASSFIGGGYSHNIGNGVVTVYRSAIVGGDGNIVLGSYSAIIAGDANQVDGDRSVIIGGTTNVVEGDDAFMAASTNSTMDSSATKAAIIGGNSNAITGDLAGGATTTGSAIVGGTSNTVTADANATNADANYSGIFAGSTNTLQDSNNTVIVGGNGNTIDASTTSAVVGGSTNLINGDSTDSAVLAGYANTISNANWSNVVGGRQNLIEDINDGVAFGKNAHVTVSNVAAHGGGSWDPGNAIQGQAQGCETIGRATLTTAATAYEINPEGDTAAHLRIDLEKVTYVRAYWMVKYNGGGILNHTVAGIRYALIENNAGTLTIVSQGDLQAAVGNTGSLTVTPLFDLSYGGADEYGFSLTSSSNNCRAVVRYVWEELWYEP